MCIRDRYSRPLVIVLGVGTGNGSRTGGSPLAQLLGKMGQIIGNCVVVCSGNEANARLHYQGRLGDGKMCIRDRCKRLHSRCRLGRRSC